MSDKVVTFGEIMMRLSTPGHLRFTQARTFDVTYAGAECNVAVSLANYGVPVDYVTRLPDNDLGQACLRFIRGEWCRNGQDCLGAVSAWGFTSWKVASVRGEARWFTTARTRRSRPWNRV